MATAPTGTTGSRLLDALIMLFDTLWDRAIPLGPHVSDSQLPARDVLSTGDRTLLTLLAAGLKDEAIAQQLGVTERTVARRMQRLFTVLGVRTRFQAGLKAAEIL